MKAKKKMVKVGWTGMGWKERFSYGRKTDDDASIWICRTKGAVVKPVKVRVTVEEL